MVLIEAQSSNLLCFASKDVIPNAVKINDKRFKFISLKKSALEWSKIIFSNLKFIDDRNNNLSHFRNSGFDINEEVKKMDVYFERE